MKSLTKLAVLAASASALASCTSLDSAGSEYGFSPYALVRVHQVQVGDHSLSVAPPRPWNRVRPRLFEDIRETEDWTLDGPILDGVSFVTGLKGGKRLIREDRHEAQQVPKFRSDMTAPEIASMIESLFRVKGGAVEFRTLALQPRSFLGSPGGFELDYEHLDSDELWRKGRVVGAVINGRLYLILLDAARSHYYNATLPDFESIVDSARLRA